MSLFFKSPRPAVQAHAGMISWSWQVADPLDAETLWAAPKFRAEPRVIDEAGRSRYGIRQFLADHPRPLPESRDKPAPWLNHLLVEIARPVWDHDRLFNGSEGIYTFIQTLTQLILRQTGDTGQTAPRIIVVPHDHEPDAVTVRIGTNLYLPEADEAPEAQLSLRFDPADGGPAREIPLPVWPLVRAQNGLILPVLRPVGLYAGQRRLVLGFSPEEAPIVLPCAGLPGARSLVLDLTAIRLALARGQIPPETRCAVQGGQITLKVIPGTKRVETSPAAAEIVLPDKGAAPEPVAPDPVKPAPALPRFLRAIQGGGARLRREPSFGEADKPEAKARVEPAPIPAFRPLTIPTDRQTLVQAPMRAVQTPIAPDPTATLVLPPAELPESVAPRFRLSVTALALPRLDGKAASTRLEGWRLALDATGMPMAEDVAAEPPALILHANPDWANLLYKRPESAKWRIARPGGDGLGRLTPVPLPLAAAYHGFLSLPRGPVLTLAAEQRYRLGRAGEPGDAARLVLGLLALPGSLGPAAGGLTLEDLNFSRDHLNLHIDHGQLHVAMAQGKAPVWRLSADGETVERLHPGAGGSLVMVSGESLVIGGYVIRFTEA